MLIHIAVFGVGIIAGFLNVMAGGGSLMTLPILIFFGLPVAVANGTNRVAILAQNLTAVAAFRRHGYTDIRTGLALALTTVPGAVAGALVAITVSEGLFRAILAGVLVVAVIGLLVRRQGREQRHDTPRHARLVAFLSFFAVGFYGGFVQAGVGFLIMIVLHQLLQFDLVRTNMHKVLIVLVFSVPALMVFAFTGNVAWPTAIALAVGNSTGAIVATRVTVSGGERSIRMVLGIALLLMAVRLVW
ncbi:MAG: hypothetical protein AMS18_07735 [Gemmatimonas sp. SG8_17]|nr:MAG: hypothetical protein AMS18_07735 [Gemmatimonas sp. SG8_17]